MKTTIEIADALLLEARHLASIKHTTLRQVVEEGLRAVINGQREQRFQLPDASFAGEGAQITEWQDVRREIYEGRGE